MICSVFICFYGLYLYAAPKPVGPPPMINVSTSFDDPGPLWVLPKAKLLYFFLHFWLAFFCTEPHEQINIGL